MKPITIIFIVLALAGTVAVWWQRESARELRREVESFTTPSFTNTIDSDNPHHDLREEIRALREQTKGLPKLRNEVGQLRAIQPEIEKARAEKTHLLEAKRTGKILPAVTSVGFVTKDQLHNAGFATPEAALETYFWARREMNLAMLIQSQSPKSRERKELERMTPAQREDLELQFAKAKADGKSMMAMMENFTDFGITERVQTSDDKAVLHVGSSTSPGSMKLSFERVGNEWRLLDSLP